MNINIKLKLLLSILLFFQLVSCSDSDGNEIVDEPKLTFSVYPSNMELVIDPIFGKGILVVIDGDTLRTSNDVTWFSENTSIATVTDNGGVFGKTVGKTNIIATRISDGSIAKCEVTVVDKAAYKIRLNLKDKGKSEFEISNPKQFLSAKAIERRQKYSIPINQDDLPLNSDYLKQIEEVGGKIAAQSKWLKTVTVHCDDASLINNYKKLPFVESVDTVWIQYSEFQWKENLNLQEVANFNIEKSYYGSALLNIQINNGLPLHEGGFKGEGMDIAVIDAGFINFESNPSLQNVKVKGAKSFIYEDKNPFAQDYHGITVLSTMAGNMKDKFIGTAPEANYWLLRTEDNKDEYPAEEDYWVAAAEYADSVGVDVITTSLGYTNFNYGYKSYRSIDMDGKTAFATRGANIASQKGILIVCCSGNHRDWVGTPADSPNVLTVGSIYKSGKIGYATAWGMTHDGRIKPDVLSLGEGASIIEPSGAYSIGSGSSYATPIISGLATCLWQAYPQLTNKEIIDVIRKSADRYSSPELPYGYGIPDMEIAMKIAGGIVK